MLYTYISSSIEFTIPTIAILDLAKSVGNWITDGYRELLMESNLSNPFLQDNVTKICKPVLEEFYSL